MRVFYLDAFQIAREEAGSAELQLRMQGNAFQGAFFAASPVCANAGLSEETLFRAIEKQLESKFGAKGARVVQNNLTVVKRGYQEIHEITDKTVGAARAGRRQEPRCRSCSSAARQATPRPCRRSPTFIASGSRPATSTPPARATTICSIRSSAPR